MKICHCLIISALFPLSQGERLRASSSRKRHLLTNEDIDSIQFTTETGQCDYDTLAAALAVDCENCDLNTILGKKNDEVGAREKVDMLCHDAISNNSNANQGAYHFSKITGEGFQFDNEFFDGGTPLNAEYEDREIAQSQGGSNIQSVFDDVAQEKLITFPHYLKDNFVENCQAQAIMCCWVQDRQANDNNGNCNDNDCYNKDPADNTDVCYVDLAASTKSNHVEGGFAIFPGDAANTGEGDAHCHGFTWSDDPNAPDNRYRGNVLFYVSMYDHLETRGYVRNVPGAPMCSCIDKSPIVSRSDCTNVEVKETFFFEKKNGNKRFIGAASITNVDVIFNNCPTEDNQNNDLEQWYNQEVRSDTVSQSDKIFDKHIVGDCNAGDHYEKFLESKGFALKQ